MPMNDTKIPTCDRTWNPGVGCWRNCNYCWAKPIAIKLYGSFEPKFIPERLIQPKQELKPANVFVGSMCDMWGDWVDAQWIKRILAAARAADWHTYQFYTKDPTRYAEFATQLPSNAWLGCTLDTGFDVDRNGKRSRSPTNEERIELLNRVRYPRKFVSIEPYDPAQQAWYAKHVPFMDVQWVHVGFRTFGQGRIADMPKSAWDSAAELCMAFDKRKIPVFPKESISANDPDSWPGKWRRALPAGMSLQSKSVI